MLRPRSGFAQLAVTLALSACAASPPPAAPPHRQSPTSPRVASTPAVASALAVAPAPAVADAAITTGAAALISEPRRGLQAIRDCLSYAGELRLRPKPRYRAPGLRGLANKLGLRVGAGQTVRDAFCEPTLWEQHCAYTDCWSQPGAALVWKRLDKHSDDLSGLLVVEEPGASVAAYQVGDLELNEPEFACGCMASSEFATVSQPAIDTLVVEYQAESRVGRMCSDRYSKSTWLLDEQRRPIAAVVETGALPPAQITVMRSASALTVRLAERCEATVDWAELAAPRP